MEFLVITFPLDIIFVALSESIPILEKRQRSCMGGLGFLPGFPSHQKQHRLGRRECPSHLEGSFVKTIQSLNPIGCVNHPMKLWRIVQIGEISHIAWCIETPKRGVTPASSGNEGTEFFKLSDHRVAFLLNREDFLQISQEFSPIFGGDTYAHRTL